MSYQQIGSQIDVMSDVSAPMIGDSVSSVFSRENLRPVTQFFGLDVGIGGWSFPSLDNVKKNISYFQLNYILISTAILAFNFVISTTFSEWVGLAMLAGVWFVFVRASADSAGTITIPVIRQELPEKQASIGLAAISLIIIFMLCGNAIWHALFECAVVCGLHSALRKAPSDDAGLVPGGQV